MTPASRPKSASILALALGLASLAVPAAAQGRFDGPAGTPHVYKSSAGKDRTMEIHFPPDHDPARSKVPGMILFHGGGWKGGSLAQFRAACAYFARRGLVCATAEYRMHGPSDPAPAAGESFKRVCVTDAKSAIRWFKQQAPALGVDPKRIITGGGSAGGHISALATLNPGLNDPADPAGIDTTVVAYLWFNPAFQATDQKDPEIDVFRHMTGDLPPALVFFGDEDPWKKGWDPVHSKWKELGAKDIRVHIAQGQAHGYFNDEPWRGRTLREAERFLAELGLIPGNASREIPDSGEKTPPAP